MKGCGSWVIHSHLSPGLQAATNMGPVVQRPISASPRLNFNAGFYISFFQSLLDKIFSVLFGTSNDQLAIKKI